MRAPLPMLPLIAAALLAGCGGGSRSATTATTGARVAHVHGGSVAVRVSRAPWERCDVHCAERYPVGFGYRCDAFPTGEAVWTVDCRRGRRLVHLGIAD